MNALILRGKHKGEVYEVSQWCNDWFMLESDNYEVARKPLSPSALAFTYPGIREIKDHENNGTLMGEFEIVEYKGIQLIDTEIFAFTFKRRKL